MDSFIPNISIKNINELKNDILEILNDLDLEQLKKINMELASFLHQKIEVDLKNKSKGIIINEKQIDYSQNDEPIKLPKLVLYTQKENF
jgi:hypothetical protein